LNLELRNIRSFLGRNLNNISGWSSNRKIIVIESDDWGTIRMPSKKVFNNLIEKGIPVNKCSFCKYDSLASEKDLSLLFEVLLSHETKNQKKPIITANTIVANPNFDRILEADFSEYFFETFTDTLKRYPEHLGSFKLWEYGQEKQIFHPQLHGREHLNVNLWMDFLKKNSKETRMTFDFKMFGISTDISNENRKSYMASFNYENAVEIENQKKILREAQEIFTKKFGYKSQSFIAPNYVWSPKLEETMLELGIEFIQTSRNQIVPDGELKKDKYVRHYTGQKNQAGQIYLVRNCIFEPSTSSTKDHVKECLSQITTSFRWKKPAIISSHRLNYIGFIDEENRTKNLKLLDNLLCEIIKKWPEVEFMTSDELGRLIKNQN